MVGATLGGFEILEEIGRGGMGIVYKARQTSLNRAVALKVLPPELAHSPTAAERFSHEAHNMARLSHPNIVKVYEVGEQDGIHYFAMEYVEGKGTLRDVIEREGPMSSERAAEIGAQVADGLGYAHSQGVIHRDVKPANIMIDQHGQAVVTDFGIAKVDEVSGLTATGVTIGAPEYMSPEQVKGNPIDGRSDIYSLGVTLYEMVSGRVPFVATTPIALAMKHVNEFPHDPRELRPECPEWLASIILRALAKEPAERFGTAQEMAAALRAAKPVTAPTMQVPVGGYPHAAAHPPVAGVPALTVPPRPDRKWAIAAVASAIVIVGALMAIVWLVQSPVSKPPEPPPPPAPEGGSSPPAVATAMVRDMTGLEATDAARRLKSAGNFAVSFDPPEYSDIHAEGAVISQRPPAGVQLRRGNTVRLVKSLGPEPRASSPTSSNIIVDRFDSTPIRSDWRIQQGVKTLTVRPQGGALVIEGVTSGARWNRETGLEMGPFAASTCEVEVRFRDESADILRTVGLALLDDNHPNFPDRFAVEYAADESSAYRMARTVAKKWKSWRGLGLFGDEHRSYHTLRVRYDAGNGSGTGWVDGMLVGSKDIRLSSIKARMYVSTATDGVKIEVYFDDFRLRLH